MRTACSSRNIETNTNLIKCAIYVYCNAKSLLKVKIMAGLDENSSRFWAVIHSTLRVWEHRLPKPPLFRWAQELRVGWSPQWVVGVQLLVRGSPLSPGHPSVSRLMLCPEDARLSPSLLLACTMLFVPLSVGVSTTECLNWAFGQSSILKPFGFPPWILRVHKN